MPRLVMQSEVTISIIARLKSILLCTMFVFTAFSASLAGVQAVGANQNDFYQWWGTGYGDLPDDNISAQNSFPTFPYSYMAPHYSGVLTAELDVNDDEDDNNHDQGRGSRAKSNSKKASFNSLTKMISILLIKSFPISMRISSTFLPKAMIFQQRLKK